MNQYGWKSLNQSGEITPPPVTSFPYPNIFLNLYTNDHVRLFIRHLPFPQAMPSFRATLASYAVQWKFSHRKNATPQGILDDIRDTWRAENAREVVPTSDEELFNGWQVFHVRPRGEKVETRKVVVYWHGGESDFSGSGGICAVRVKRELGCVRGE